MTTEKELWAEIRDIAEDDSVEHHARTMQLVNMGEEIYARFKHLPASEQMFIATQLVLLSAEFIEAATVNDFDEAVNRIAVGAKYLHEEDA